MKKLEFRPEDFNSFNIRHIVNGKPVNVDGASEVCAVAQAFFDAWYKENIDGSPEVRGELVVGNEEGIEHIVPKVLQWTRDIWFDGDETHSARLVDIKEIEQ